MRVVIGVSGGSGAPIAVKLLGYLKDHETHLVISDSGKKVLLQETGLKPEDVYTSATYHYDDSDISPSRRHLTPEPGFHHRWSTRSLKMTVNNRKS